MPQDTTKAKYGFSTYKNYLLGLSYLLNQFYPDYVSLNAKLKNIQRNTNPDLERIRKLLFNSWSSETMLLLPQYLNNEDFIKFSNHWSPVQAYYSIYLALRALIVARNIQASGDHATSLNVFASNFVGGQKLFPEPFNYLIGAQQTYSNLPIPHNIQFPNTQENPFFFKNDNIKLINSVCLFLKSTRDRIVDERCDEWKIKNPTSRGVRLKLPSGKRIEIDNSQRNITLLDCFYRLRTRSNYKDVDIFILGANDHDSKIYLNALCNITDKILLIIEYYITQSIGPEAFTQILEGYRSANTIDFIRDKKAGVSFRNAR